MGGVNYMGGKRNAARFRAKDMTSRIQKGFFRKQKLASLTKAQSGRASAASKEAEPISLSHALHRRDSRDEAPTISLHVKRTNSTSSRTVDKEVPSRPKTGGRSEFLDALDTTEPTLLRGLLNRVLVTPDLAGLSSRKRKRTPPPPYTPARRRRADAQEGATRRRDDRHVSPDTSYVMVSANDEQEDLSEELANPTFTARISNPFDTSDDESEPSQTGFVTNYRTSTCSEHQRTSSTNLTSSAFAASNAIPSARVQDWPDNIFEHKDPWKSIGRIIGLHEDNTTASSIATANKSHALAASYQQDLIADDEDGWFEIPSTPSAPTRVSQLSYTSLHQEVHGRLDDNPHELPLQPLAQAADVDSDRSCYAQDLSSRPPSSLASTSSHSLHTSIFRDSVDIGEQDRLRSTTAASTSSPANFAQDKLSSDARGSDCSSSRADASSSRVNAPSRQNASSSRPNAMSSRNNEAETSSCDGRSRLSAPSDASRFPALSYGSRVFAPSDGTSLPVQPLGLTRSPAARLFLSSVHSGSSRPSSRYAHADAPSTTHVLSSDGGSSICRLQNTSSAHARFGAMSQLISEAPSPVEFRPRTRKPFYGDQHSASTSSPLRIPTRTSPPLQSRDAFNDAPPKFTETIPSRDQLVHYASSSPYRSSVRLVRCFDPELGDALPAISPLRPVISSPPSAPRRPLSELGEPPGRHLPAFSKSPAASNKPSAKSPPAYSEHPHAVFSKPLPNSMLSSTPVPRPSLLPTSGFEPLTSISPALYQPRIKGARVTSAAGKLDEAALEVEEQAPNLGGLPSVYDLFVQSPEGGFEPLRHSEPGSPELSHAHTSDTEEGALSIASKRVDDAAVVPRGVETGTAGRASSAAGRMTTERRTPCADDAKPATGTDVAKPAKDADLSSALLVAAGIVPIGADPGEAGEGKGNGPCLFFEDAIEDELESDE